jgi:hypothetical protein
MLVLILTALLTGHTESLQVNIKSEHLIRNKDDSCVWVSLTALAKHNKVRRGYKLYPTYKGGADTERAVRALMKHKIPFYYQNIGVKKTGLMRWACKHGYGCAFGVKGHVLLMVHWDKDHVKVIDNAGKYALKVQKWSKKKFHEKWSGRIYVILPLVRERHALWTPSTNTWLMPYQSISGKN